MAETSSLAKRLTLDFPQLSFQPGNDFRWSPQDQTVYYVADDTDDTRASLLHETAHGLLSHQGFSHDIELLKIEREAWEYASRELAPTYAVVIDQSAVEDALDSYRNWLHNRSLCPECHQNGVQDTSGDYSCLACGTSWRANDARRCALRRYKNAKNTR